MTVLEARPLVSIITPVYNGARFLDDLIQSVLRQDYPQIEHIIIDDGSTDGGATVEVLKRYAHLRWWSRANQGQYATLNEGIAAARGPIVGIISADDLYITPDAISRVIRYWQAHPGVDFVYGGLINIEENGALWPVQTHRTGAWPAWLLQYVLFIPHCSLFVSREIILRDGLWFDPALCCTGDWDWIIRLSKSGRKFGYVGRPLSMYRIRADQVSQTQRNRIAVERREICRRYSTNYLLFFLLNQLFDLPNMLLVGWRVLRTSGPKSLLAKITGRLRRSELTAPR